MGRAFKEQIVWLSRAWDGWSEAEQVVALYSVARKLSPVPNRFLQILLTYNFPLDGTDIIISEARANDPAWVSHINESGDSAASDLLHHLPLLHPSNGEAKAHYLTLIPKVLSNAISQGSSQPSSLEKARQLLSYSLIHPALSPEERRALGTWLKTLEEKLNQINEHNSEANRDHRLEEKRLSECSYSENNASSSHWNESPTPVSLSGQNKDDIGPRWNHLEVPHSPNNSVASSRSSESESISEDNTLVISHPGMRDIGVWLKSLRLHKYTPLLCNLKYEDLLALTEKDLEAKGVTKGARHKIILSIAKLRERPKQLENIEKDIMNGGSISAALNQLKQIAITPMLPSTYEAKHSEETNQNYNLQLNSTEPDLASQFTRVMGKMCTQLLVCARPEDEAMSSFLSLVDKCMYHEAFSNVLTKRLLSWKQQILRIWHPVPPKGKETRHMRRWSHQYSGEVNRSIRYHHRYSNAGLLAPSVASTCLQAHLTPPNQFYSSQASQVGTLIAPRNSLPGITSIGSSLLSPQHFLSKRPSLQETPSQLRPHITLQRTRSAPSRPHQLPLLNQIRTPPSIPTTHLTPDRQPVPVPIPVPIHRHHADSFSSWSGRDAMSHNQFPPSSEPPPGGGISYEVAESDLTNRLESLCLSMTEHALG